jgi:hypothetical protein
MFTDDELRVLDCMTNYSINRQVYFHDADMAEFLVRKPDETSAQRWTRGKAVLASIKQKAPQLLIHQSTCDFRYRVNTKWLFEFYLKHQTPQQTDAQAYIECLEKAGMI